jgi:hypothetical protein
MRKPFLILFACLTASIAQANFISEGDSLFALRAKGFQPKTGLVEGSYHMEAHAMLLLQG